LLGGNEKQLVWVGDSLDKLKAFPEEVKDAIGFALRFAQSGEMHPDAKPLNKGTLKGKGIYEITGRFMRLSLKAVYMHYIRL